MSVVGFQDYWVTGSRFYFTRATTSGGTQYRDIDFGTLQSVTPNISTEKITLNDPDGGVNTAVAENVTSTEESYDITCSNMSLRNLAFLYLAAPPQDYGQTAGIVTSISRTFFEDSIHKVRLADGNYAYNLTAALAVATTDVVLGTELNLAQISKTGGLTAGSNAAHLKIDGDQTSAIAADETIFIRTTNLTDAANAGAYTIDSDGGTNAVVYDAGTTSTYVRLTTASAGRLSSSETPSTDGNVGYATTGTLQDSDADWEVQSLPRGLLRIPSGSTLDGGTFVVISEVGAIGADRLVLPQTSSEISGTGLLVFSRGGNQELTFREFPCTVAPASADFNQDDFSSIVLTVRVTSDTAATEPAGRLVAGYGSIPTGS